MFYNTLTNKLLEMNVQTVNYQVHAHGQLQ